MASTSLIEPARTSVTREDADPPDRAPSAERPVDASAVRDSPVAGASEDDAVAETGAGASVDEGDGEEIGEAAAGPADVVPEVLPEATTAADAGTLNRARATVHVTPELTATSIVAAMANQRTLMPLRRDRGAAASASRRETSGITGASRRASMPLHRSREGVRTGSDRADSTIPSRSATSIAHAMHDS